MHAPPLLVRARELITCSVGEADLAMIADVTFEELGLLHGAAMLTDGANVVAIGTDREITSRAPQDAVELDLRDCVVVPGFVDAHAHPLFAGDREPDFAARTHSARAAQGMLYTVERTREALRDPQAFYDCTVRPRLQTMLAHGTTTLETKTGYALTKEGEIALLDLITAHQSDADVPRLIATFLGAHALPPEFSSTAQYVEYLIGECLEPAKAHGAVFADAFCEPGFFSTQECRRYIEAARHIGLLGRLHCDEMADGGAAAMAADLGVVSFDHCNFVTDEVARSLAHSGRMVACPATIAFLGIEGRPPVRRILELGGVVALASDYNPGTSPCFNLQTVAYYGRALFGMSAAEALYGVTRAGARTLHASLRRSGWGMLRAGEPADFVALRMDDPREFGWQFGGNLARVVVKDGVVVRG